MALTKLLCNGQRAILICDGVGVGKTISAGYVITYLTSALRKPALVVCPPSLVDKWYLELVTKFNTNAVPIRSGEELNLTTDHWDLPNDNPRVFILPASLIPQAMGGRFSGPIVFDEIHNYRNPATNLWAAAKAVSANASYRVGLTATPINNGSNDLAAELAILLNMGIYAAEALIQDAWRPGRQQVLYPLMTRFAKDRLGIHFAKREVRDVSIHVSDSYREHVMELIKMLRGRPKSESIYRDEITYFRLAASSSRAFAASMGVAIREDLNKVEQLKSILELHQAEPIIIFCEFEETVRELEDAITSRVVLAITGSVPVFLREGIVAQFRNAENAVLVMTSVGAEGIDLQFCSTLVNYDLNWNPMVLEQRIGRIDRIGQKKATIKIYNFVVGGSIDARIVETLGRKLGLVEGSILEPATVLGSSDFHQRSLFTDQELDKELRRAESLAQAVALTSEIIPQDYDVLTEVDVNYCDAGAIREAAVTFPKLNWLKQADPVERGMSQQSVQLQRLIEFYHD